MAKLRRFWHIKLVLIIVQTLQLSQAVPCLNIKCPIDGKQRVGSGLAASLKPSELLQTKAANPQEIYPTVLETEGHPSHQPFPDSPGTTFQILSELVHPRAPQLDIPPPDAVSPFLDCRGCRCPDLPFVSGLLPATWHGQYHNQPGYRAEISKNTTIPAPVVANSSSSSPRPHCSARTPATGSSTRMPRLISTRSTSIKPAIAGFPSTGLCSNGFSSSETSLIRFTSTSSTSSTYTSMAAATLVTSIPTQDVFLPISTGPIPPNIRPRNDHPLPKGNLVNSPGPISTNKFYANFFVGTQSNYSFTHPYSVAWSKGNGAAKSYGLAISHIEAHQVAMGEPNPLIPGNPARFYINPVGIQSLILSATELHTSTILSISRPLAFSADVVLQPQAGCSANVTYPLVQGMGFVTGVYNDLQPAIQSDFFFREIVCAAPPKEGMFKYRLTLENSASWLLYVIPADGANPNLELVSGRLLRGPAGFNGTIQVAKNPAGEAGEATYDGCAGVYPTSNNILGHVSTSDATGTYSFVWDKAGKDVSSTPLLMFALPHHVESFDETTQENKTALQLRTTTKGLATAYVGDFWTMIESDLPLEMGFSPWRARSEPASALSGEVIEVIKNVASTELSQDIATQTYHDSMYYSGKALGKFAMLVYTVHELLQDAALASAAFHELKTSFARFVNNEMLHPLVYDTVWKGVVSSGSYDTGDPGLDFGNTYYNDHHFHYGYFILVAAIIGHLDPSWLDVNKDWVNMLVRDAANSNPCDDLFPFSRAFDWYHGHSWAKGLFESLDGKDEESTSEDTMFAYAIKMWGKTIGDSSMEARGNLQLAILKRTLQSYFLMSYTNANQPPNFISNKVTGILFENKVDHTTYFGTNLEYIQCIHMLPLIPSSAYTRRRDFVQEEWDALFAPGGPIAAENVTGGWKGILFANLAIIDPAKSWDFFAQQAFDFAWLDSGASRTWYLTYAAGGLAQEMGQREPSS